MESIAEINALYIVLKVTYKTTLLTVRKIELSATQKVDFWGHHKILNHSKPLTRLTTRLLTRRLTELLTKNTLKIDHQTTQKTTQKNYHKINHNLLTKVLPRLMHLYFLYD